MKKNNIYNPKVMEALIKETGYSLDYIRKSLRGDRVGIMPDKIQKRYKELDTAATNAIEVKLNS